MAIAPQPIRRIQTEPSARLRDEYRGSRQTVVAVILPSTLHLSHEQFAQLAAANRDCRLELTATGEVIVMPPTGGDTGQRNLDIGGQIWWWNRQRQLGKAFDSSTGFRLPNGAVRSPDASWVSLPHWDALSPEERRRFLPLCPDFAIELVSESDTLLMARAKMQEYLENGLQLGWLIDPKTRLVEVYRPGHPPAEQSEPATLSGESLLPGFILELRAIW
ncbi:MAG: Uma2 family endonuclease [Spirulinaceae cyanobacterium RM2_2_10]|nr:Uma2 family endonuclease [Spirulinaceae cyanobacterium SM2_1_0]NJO19063.1 Uma2 family endonuclease [Spirulinaceae cyanobacterium RM2_2_10]